MVQRISMPSSDPVPALLVSTAVGASRATVAKKVDMAEVVGGSLCAVCEVCCDGLLEKIRCMVLVNFFRAIDINCYQNPVCSRRTYEDITVFFCGHAFHTGCLHQVCASILMHSKEL